MRKIALVLAQYINKLKKPFENVPKAHLDKEWDEGLSRLQTKPTREDVVNAYIHLLGRLPESEEAIASYLRATPTNRDLIKAFANSSEFAKVLEREISAPQSPFFHFNSTIDISDIINAHINHERAAQNGYFVNFLGVAMPTKIMPHLAGLEGQLDHIPIPANHHADMAEWGASLRAVDLAQDTFTMIELGCGWGCWMNNTGIAAKARGLSIHVIGIEGDEKHLEFATETLELNGILQHEYTLKQGIAAPRTGYALFPHRQNEDRWGAEPIFDVSEADSQKAVATGEFDRLPMIPLDEIVYEFPKIDLVHMDIQGGEASFVEQHISLLSERVAYLVIGTHSRSIEGQLFDILLNAGWMIEIERSAIFQISEGQPITTVDGVQGWRNPKFHTA